MLKLVVKVFFMMVISPFAISNVIVADDKWPSNLQKLEGNQPVIEVGKASFSFMLWDIYNSKLATSTGKYPLTDEKGTLVYTINYQRDISSQDLVERTVEQWEHLKVGKNTYKPYVAPLSEMWPDIKKGDSLALVSNESGSGFYHNDTFVGSIQNTEFSSLFLSIWLSQKTSEPDLREQLLGVK